MNYSGNIIEYLERLDRIDATLVLAANVYPMIRTYGDMRPSMSQALSVDDVSDTFRAFLSLTPNAEHHNKRQEGSFSFGVKGSGRFRVHYLTQRNSRVLTVSRVPNDIPDLKELITDPGAAQMICERLVAETPGLIVITSRSEMFASMFVYSLLQQINQLEASKLVFVMEPSLTFLMKHENAIIVQCELNSDVDSVEICVRNALNLVPDIAYFGSIFSADGLERLSRLFAHNRRVILSGATLTPQALIAAVRPPIDYDAAASNHYNMLVSVSAEPSGRLAIQVMDAP